MASLNLIVYFSNSVTAGPQPGMKKEEGRNTQIIQENLNVDFFFYRLEKIFRQFLHNFINSCFQIPKTWQILLRSWRFFLVYLIKILFLEFLAKVLHVRTYLDVFLPRILLRSYQDLSSFNMLLIKMFQVSFHWVNAQKRMRVLNAWTTWHNF